MLGLKETRVDPELEPFLISPHCTYRTDQPPYEGDTVTGAHHQERATPIPKRGMSTHGMVTKVKAF